jgi:hypothetical protein
MVPSTREFSDRLRMFPYLINSCNILWMRDWPISALQSVGKGLI